ncbi:ABC transporter permease [Geoalkalibacter sp.]|uniref:ABC transporter permease n=1 Tax=Geoalkalibacter sp. TaxID=3041440 RepID=UPI00272EC5EC|nr:ABC transporter permease [Geoalkalibacter sp.]
MILTRAGLRFLRRHPLQLLFAVIGVALGVAVVIGIDLANGSAARAFRLSAQTLSGQASHQIIGGPQGLEEETYARLRVAGGLRDIAPVVEGYVALPAVPGQTLRIFGIDPLAEGPFRSYTPRLAGGADVTRLLVEPGSALLLEGLAQRLDLALGETFLVESGGRSLRLTLAGTLSAPDELTARALDHLIVVDIATAQETLGQLGRLSRIDLILPEGVAGETRRAAIRALLPPATQIIPASTRGEVMAQMTRAFQLNLNALSLLALVVGMFLIYNTLAFSVLQRRPLLGILRTLGVGRAQIFRLILGEALLIGMAGTLLGLLLGVGLGQGLLRLVTRTINDLYFVLNVSQLDLSPWSLAKGVALGLGATLGAALVPAWEATRAAPRLALTRSTLESQQRRLAPWIALAGLVLAALGGLGLILPGRSLVLSFLALFAVILGYALAVPGLLLLLLRLLQAPLGLAGGLLGRMAARDLGAALSRSGVATAALVVAVAATIGVGLMIGSFRLTVAQWLESYLRADIYISTPSAGFEAGRAPLDPQLAEELARAPGVAFATRARHLLLDDPGGSTELFVVDIPPRAQPGYRFKSGDPQRIWREFDREAVVIVSEPFAYHRNLRVDDLLELRTDQGPIAFRILGIHSDYGSDQGRVTLSRAVFARYWHAEGVDALGLYLEAGQDADRLAETLRALAGDRQQLVIYSNRALREASLATFDRTFAITAVLRLLAVLVAFVGILNALMAMQIERSRDLAVLRANGLTPRQLWRLVSAETGLIGLCAGLLALPLGIVQALALIHVINRRSFGWTMQTVLAPDILGQALLLALGAALLAGLYPAWRMARTSPALALREE